MKFKYFILIISFLVIGTSNSYAQTQKDFITIKDVFGGYEFYQGEKILDKSQLENTLKTNQEAYKQIESAQTSYTLAMACSYAGGFMVGWPLGTAIAGGDPNWLLAGIGAGLIVVSIPLNNSYYSTAKEAVETYNNGLQTSSFWDKSDLKLTITGNGIGLTLTF